MTLYFIGLGLSEENDITVKGLETLRTCKKVYLESYTSLLQCPKEQLEAFYGRPIISADRVMVEQNAESTILADAQTQDVAFLVPGDPLAATTHIDLFLRAKEKNIAVRVIHNASIMNAIASTGLELYKFGRTTSIVFPQKNWKPETPYQAIKENKERGLHTLCLLDIHAEAGKFMTVQEGLQELLELAQKSGRTDDTGIITLTTMVVACARIGSDSQQIAYGSVQDILTIDFGRPLHCIIIPGELHFKEEEMLQLWRQS
ncbi:diphthine synthase [Candidatus Woesearchaeota archaeon]|nr:diphthine synthase [Candidatus Woesearchaeota archaeon]